MVIDRPPLRPIKRLLVANRGEIATRILASARELDIETYSLYTSDDTSHCYNADHAISLPSPSSYLDIPRLVAIVKDHGIDAVHPGYGFLSESGDFAKAMWEQANAVVIGPGWEIIGKTGDKLQARALGLQCLVPVLPAMQTPTDRVESVSKFAMEMGFPIVIKAVDGGGGRGIRVIHRENDLAALMERALRESPCRKVFAEKAAIDGYRHIEVQIVGDGHGNLRHLWERECSIQRRYQKVVEFAPSSIQDRKLVEEIVEAALRMAKKINYVSLGTFEFLVKSNPPEFYFLEVNPRIQVEHTVTESICMGIDLVKIQLLIAAGQPLSSIPDIKDLPTLSHTVIPLHSLQLRLTAEDVSNNWSLSVGKITSFQFPTGNGIRIDTHILPPLTIIKSEFDSLVAKIIITAPTWKSVVSKAKRALEDTAIAGVKTNLDALRGIVNSPDFESQDCDTQWLETSLHRILEIGARVSKKHSTISHLRQPRNPAPTMLVSPSNVLFRKGDAWTIKMTPEPLPTTSASNNKKEVEPTVTSHLQLTRIHRNEFPASLTASLLYTNTSLSSNAPPKPLLVTITTTASSATALASTQLYRRGNPHNPNHITAPFPGKLVEILVEEGDVIAKGDVVAIVKQMKMELEIRAGRGGTVVWVFEGGEGDIGEEGEGVEVGEGVLIAEIGGEVARL